PAKALPQVKVADDLFEAQGYSFNRISVHNESSVTHHLAQRAVRRYKRGDATCERLCRRQSEPLVNTGIGEGLGYIIKQHEVFILNKIEEDHSPTFAVHSLGLGQYRLVQPALAPGQHQR